MAQRQPIFLSYPTFGPSGDYTAGATYIFFSGDYTPPAEGRSLGKDVVHNRNGVYKYLYDNGPNFNEWSPFRLTLDDAVRGFAGTATQQWQNLQDLWTHIGQLKLGAPEGSYAVHWAEGMSLSKRFLAFPAMVGDKIEYSVDVQFEEA